MAVLMVTEPDNKFMPISHTRLTKYLSGIEGGKPTAHAQYTYPICQVRDTDVGFLAEKEFLKKV